MDDAAQPADTENPDQVTGAAESGRVDDVDANEGFVPRGAMIFAWVLIAGYVICFFLIWYEIVVLRGGA